MDTISLRQRSRSCAIFNNEASQNVASWQIVLQKSYPLGIKNSPGCRRDFDVKMWGTSSPDDKLTGDLGNAREAAEIGGRWSDRILAGKIVIGRFRTFAVSALSGRVEVRSAELVRK